MFSVVYFYVFFNYNLGQAPKHPFTLMKTTLTITKYKPLSHSNF